MTSDTVTCDKADVWCEAPFEPPFTSSTTATKLGAETAALANWSTSGISAKRGSSETEERSLMAAVSLSPASLQNPECSSSLADKAIWTFLVTVNETSNLHLPVISSLMKPESTSTSMKESKVLTLGLTLM